MITSASPQAGNNKVAIVTGSSGGIGKAVSARLAKDGFSAVVGYSGGAEKANQVVSDIEAAGGAASAVQAGTRFWRPTTGRRSRPKWPRPERTCTDETIHSWVTRT